MFKDFIAKIEAQYADELPFVVYRKPKEQKVRAVLQVDTSLDHLTDFSQTGFVFAPFDTEKEIVLLRPDGRLQAEIKFSKTSQSTFADQKVDNSQKNFHIDLVKNAVEEIRKGSFEKVVLSRRVEVDCKDMPLDLFERLLKNYQNAFCYLWYHPKVGMWMGATPEILLKGENRQITTMSLAGTQKFSGDANPFWGSKELEEQNLVTKYISDALEGKVENLRISERETVRAGDLLHLRTKLVASYTEGQLGGIVNALHPTPAVCGMPMRSSKDFILKNENYDREFYTGFLGELNLKYETARSSQRKNQENQAYRTIKARTTFFVNLRCMQLKGKKAFIYVGGGITKDSNAEKEWEETSAKTSTMFKVLG